MEFKNDIAYGTICFSHTNRNRFVEREMHTFHELLYCIAGNVSVYTDGFYRSVKKGTLFLIPRGCYHLFQIHGEEPFERLWIGFSDKDLPASIVPAHWEGVRMIERLSAAELFSLQTLCDATDEGGTLAATKAYGTLIALLCSLSTATEVPPVQSESSQIMPGRVYTFSGPGASLRPNSALSQRLTVPTLGFISLSQAIAPT